MDVKGAKGVPLPQIYVIKALLAYLLVEQIIMRANKFFPLPVW